jgi:hypothetical protein
MVAEKLFFPRLYQNYLKYFKKLTFYFFVEKTKQKALKILICASIKRGVDFAIFY